MDDDSLSLEIKKYLKIRPTTTGEIGFVDKHHRLGNPVDSRVRSILTPTSIEENDDKHTVRPRAPRSRFREPSGTATIDRNNMVSGTNTHNKPMDNSKPRKQKQSVSNLLESLRFFGQTNRSRELTSTESCSIHYVNITELEHVNNPSKNGNIDTGPMFQRKHVPVENSTGKLSLVSNTSFAIPELPRGKLVSFKILSTWGDPHYVGLMSIEIFDESGRILSINNHDKQIWADPADINALPEYENDPRTVDNLLDGVNLTCDDMHAWLAPFTSGQNHYIWLDLDECSTISMIRIWNYNKSRIHSYRGVRYLEITLDSIPIFKGEIRRAIGSHSISDYESCCECILFTMKPSILAKIEQHDPIIQKLNNEAIEKQESRIGVSLSDIPYHGLIEVDNQVSGASLRPMSFVKKSSSTLQQPIRSQSIDPAQPIFSHDRPTTGAGRRVGRCLANIKDDQEARNQASSRHDIYQPSSLDRPSTANFARSQLPLTASMIDLYLKSTWGSSLGIIGITRIIGVDEHMTEFILPTPDICIATHSSTGNGHYDLIPMRNSWNSKRAVDIGGLVHGDTPGYHWYMQQPEHGIIVLRFKLPQKTSLKGLRVWNYNGDKEETYCGARHVDIHIDGKLYTTIVMRKAPGVGNFDYSQFLPLVLGSKSFFPIQRASSARSIIPSYDDVRYQSDNIESWNTDNRSASLSIQSHARLCPVTQQYETPIHPSGTMLKIVLQSTHGDKYYIGLNGIELYDIHGLLIDYDTSQLQAAPYRDVNDLVEIQKQGYDARCLENLCNHQNNTFIDRAMWLAPYAGPNSAQRSDHYNAIFILFDEPVTIGMIKIWNYAKTCTRGVKDIEIYLDDVLMYRGSLLLSPKQGELDEIEEGSLSWGTDDDMDLSQAILFTDNIDNIMKNEARIPHAVDDIEFIDEGRPVFISGNTKSLSSITRPMTAVNSR